MNARIDAMWEVPLAAVSFVLYKAVRRLVRTVVGAHFARHPEDARRWRVLSAATLSRPVALPVVMTSGPRWNTHAIVANVGPVRVARSIAINRGATDRSSPCWTVAVHAYPSHRVAAHFGSGDRDARSGSDEIAVEPGAYTLILRYYHWRHDVELPAVRIDGEPALDQQSVPSDVNAFYRDLWKRRSAVYLWLHYYVFTIVRFRRCLPAALVDREVLPVGNPETTFYYDILRPGARAVFSIDASLLMSHDIFFTVYGRDSFPVEWKQITEGDAATSPAIGKSLLLVRVQSKAGGWTAFDKSALRIAVR